MWNKIKLYLKYLLSKEPVPEKWVFIVGCNDSGTTLLHNILAKHPFIGSMPNEGQFCTDQLITPKSLGLSRIWATQIDRFYLDENSTPDINIRKLKRQWASSYNNVHKPILIEKSPPNTARVRWLQAHFPIVYFIGIHRNGYAVAEGIRRKTGYPIELCIRQWKNANEVLIRDFSKINHKALISYEDLTENTEQTLNYLVNFLNIDPFDNNILNKKLIVNGKSMGIQNMNPHSIPRLSPEEITEIDKEAKELLIKFNYKT